MSGDDVEAAFESTELVVSGDNLGPDLAAQSLERLVWCAFEKQLTARNDRHARAELANVVDDMGGKNDSNVRSDRAEEVEKAIALGGVEAGRRFVNDDELRIGE